MKELHPGSQTHPQVYLFSVWQKEEECVRSQTAPYVTSLGAVFWIFEMGWRVEAPVSVCVSVNHSLSSVLS